MYLSNYISKNILLPISDIISGQSVNSKFKFLQKSQFWSNEEIISYQNEKLRILISHAYENVSYYKTLFDDLKLKPKDIRTKDDLFKLPILTKKILKKEGLEKFTSSAFSKRALISSSSSGSTGEPLFYYRTKDAYSMNLAASLRGWYWMDYKLGDKYIILSQNPRKKLLKRLQDIASNNLYLSTNPLVDSNFNFILKEIERFKPKIIRCYPDPILLLARYKQNHFGYNHKPHAITTTGNTLHIEARKEIEEAFGCKVFDAYSCEGNANVFECSTHECYHSSVEYGISEFLDSNDNPVNEGIARLISTDLCNLAHPFIRYDTQDLVEISSEPCKCGRLLTRINRIIGRDNDILQTTSGRKFIVHNFTGFFQLDHDEINRSVELFQVIQRKDGHFQFNLVVNKNFNESSKYFIKNYWESVFKAPVDIEIVQNIPLTTSGKRRFILNQNI